MKEQFNTAKKIAVIGAGFIGVELADELNKHGYQVTLIEKLPHILNLAFDVELSEKIHQMLEERGVKVITGIGIKKVLGANSVEQIELEDGQILHKDAIVLSMGYKPNSELAKKSQYCYR